MTIPAKDAGKLYQYKVDLEGPTTAPSRLLHLVGKGRRVLEVGCSSGSQTRVLSGDLGCEVFAVEIDSAAAEHARPFCRSLVVGDIESLPLEDLASNKPYDVVLFADVLEHLHDPGAALRKVRPLIAAGGCVLASIPNITHAAVVFEMMHGRFEYRDYGLLDNTHIRFFDQLGVYRLFEEAGYLIVQTDRILVSPSQTEFRVEAVDDDDRFVLDYMKRCNPDSETFEFIVQARPGDAGEESKSASVKARRHIEDLEREVERLRQGLAKRESELEWLGRQRWYRSAKHVRSLIARVTRRKRKPVTDAKAE